MTTSTSRSLAVFNAMSAVAYAATALAWRRFEGRPLVDHLARLIEGQWGLAETGLVTAALSGALAGRVLARWGELHHGTSGRSEWSGAALRGAIVGAATVVVACVLTGECALLAGTASGLQSQDFGWRSVANLALLPGAIVLSAPMFVFVSSPVLVPTLLVALPGGAVNGVINHWVSRRARKSAG